MRLLTATVVLFVAIAHAQDDDLSSAFGPQKAKKAFEPEHNVPPAPLPTDPNAELRVTFEQQLCAAQKTFDHGDAASARDQLAMAELNAIMLGGPARVRVHQLQRAIAVKLTDPKAIKETNEKWLAACGPNDVEACRSALVEATAAYDKPRAEKIRAADACLVAAEQQGKATAACLNAALALYKKSEDTLMVARIELLRALSLPADAKKKALAKIGAGIDDRSAHVRRAALDALSQIELAEGAVDAAAKDAMLGAEAWSTTLPLVRRPWARTSAVDAACSAYDKAKGVGACRKLEKRLLGGEYLFHDFSEEHLQDGELLSHEQLVSVNEHYAVLIQTCLAAEIQSLEDKATVSYRVKWLVINNGHVDNFHSESTDQEQSRFVTCLRDQFGYWRYPRHEGDPQRIEQSFYVKSTSRTFEEK